jgi:hypothetical protein
MIYRSGSRSLFEGDPFCRLFAQKESRSPTFFWIGYGPRIQKVGDLLSFWANSRQKGSPSKRERLPDLYIIVVLDHTLQTDTA